MVLGAASAALFSLVGVRRRRRLAKTALCVTCHGAKGIGLLPDTPHLAGQPAIYLTFAAEGLSQRRAPARGDAGDRQEPVQRRHRRAGRLFRGAADPAGQALTRAPRRAAGAALAGRHLNCGSSTLSITHTVPLFVRTAVQSAVDWFTDAPSLVVAHHQGLALQRLHLALEGLARVGLARHHVVGEHRAQHTDVAADGVQHRGRDLAEGGVGGGKHRQVARCGQRARSGWPPPPARSGWTAPAWPPRRRRWSHGTPLPWRRGI